MGEPLDNSQEQELVPLDAEFEDAETSTEPSLTEEQYRLLGEVAHVVKWTAGTALGESIEKNRVGTELWLPLAMLAVLLAAGETLLAHWFSKPK